MTPRRDAFVVFALAVLASSTLTACSSPAPTPTPTSGPISAESTLLYQWMAGDTEQLWTMKGDGAEPTQLSFGVDGNNTHPDWSPDGDRLAFGVDVGDEHRAVWIANADASAAQVLVPCADECFGTDYPSWSPDGSSIVYTFYDGPGPFAGPPASSSIRVVDVETGVSRIVTSSAPGELVDNPRWSRDGATIVMQIDHFDANGNETASFIATAPSAGGEFTRITDGQMFGMYPDWSPTDDVIVFCSYDLGPFQQTTEASNLYTIRPDGTGLVQLTTFEGGGDRATQPSWLRDGSGVLITLQAEGSRTAAVVPASGGDPVRVSDVPATHTRQRP